MCLQRDAFILEELLVIVVIICVLAVLVFATRPFSSVAAPEPGRLLLPGAGGVHDGGAQKKPEMMMRPRDQFCRWACSRAASGSAFTLIELLVTLSIIAALASLVIAGSFKVGESAKRTTCLSNLRQWAGALQLYMQEHTGQIPRRGQGVRMVTQFNRSDDWFNALPPYMGLDTLQDLMTEGRTPQPGEKSVFVCPAAPKVQAGSSTFLSYGMNMYLSQWNQAQPDNIYNIMDPGQLAFMADSPGGYASTIPSAAGYSVQARHGGSACVVFCDGHAQAFKGSYLGCGSSAITQPDVRWENVSGSSSGSPVK